MKLPQLWTWVSFSDLCLPGFHHCLIRSGNQKKTNAHVRKLTVLPASVRNNLTGCVCQVPRWWGTGVQLVQRGPSLAHGRQQRCWSGACSNCQIPHWVLRYCGTEWVLSTSDTHPTHHQPRHQRGCRGQLLPVEISAVSLLSWVHPTVRNTPTVALYICCLYLFTHWLNI